MQPDLGSLETFIVCLRGLERLTKTVAHPIFNYSICIESSMDMVRPHFPLGDHFLWSGFQEMLCCATHLWSATQCLVHVHLRLEGLLDSLSGTASWFCFVGTAVRKKDSFTVSFLIVGGSKSWGFPSCFILWDIWQLPRIAGVKKELYLLSANRDLHVIGGGVLNITSKHQFVFWHDIEWWYGAC